MKFLEHLDLGQKDNSGSPTGAMVLVPILALVGCKALGLGLVASLATVAVVCVAASLVHFAWIAKKAPPNPRAHR